MTISSRELEAQRVNIFLHAENVRIFKSPEDRQLPVTIVTGFLGAGKTTLLSHILSNKSNLRVAAAINDFAELNIDENLIRHKGLTENLVELSNGCICCHLLGDLQEAVWKMLDPGKQQGGSDVDVDSVNYLVIETSGISDPARIIRTLDAKFGKCFRARLDSVVTVVDADQIICSDDHNESMTQAGLAQLQCADVVIVNKVDLLENSEQDCTVIAERIRSVNENATLHYTSHCKIPLSAILDVQVPATANTSHPSPITHEKSEIPIYISATGGALRSIASTVVHSSQNGSSSSKHIQNDDFVSISESHSDRPLSLQRLQQFVTSPLVQRLARMKGVLWIQGLQDHRCVLHLSGRGRLGFSLDGRWSGPPKSEMAFIGRSSHVAMVLIKAAFEACLVVDETLNEPSMDTKDMANVDALRSQPEFVVLEEISQLSLPNTGIVYFRLTGSEVYGYPEEEIERDLRVDTDAMNRDLVDAVNASVDTPKAFLAYSLADIDKEKGKRMVLCFATGAVEAGNNLSVVVREAKLVLASHFRNIQVCKCGA